LTAPATPATLAPGVDRAGLRGALLSWYRRAKRDLPWRHSRDPYAIWVSEIMLQQTRVETVIPYFRRFVEAWPDAAALAAAEPDRVRAAWSGLGYYRRAELMLRAAAAIVERHGGRLPDDPEALAALPGFGAYTTGAVASIAFDRPLPAVDGNVRRVLARIAGLEGAAIDDPIAELAAALAPGESPGEWTQALMELGALICTPRSPRCDRCPVGDRCLARARGAQGRIPAKKQRPARRVVQLTAVVIRQGGRAVLLEQRPLGGLFGGLWCPPLLEGHLDQAEVARAIGPRCALSPDAASQLAELTHRLTHRDLVVRVVSAARRGRRPATGLTAVPPGELDQLGVPTFTRRILAVAGMDTIRRRSHV
jgi:A/G-specific adenine glycosylase